MNRKAPPELLEYRSLSLPPYFVKNWYDFLELSGRRDTRENGPCPLSYTEVYSWCKLKGITLSEFELDVLFKLDDIWLKIQYDNIKKNRTK